MGKTTNPRLWPVCDRATVFIPRGVAPGMGICPDNRIVAQVDNLRYDLSSVEAPGAA